MGPSGGGANPAHGLYRSSLRIRKATGEILGMPPLLPYLETLRAGRPRYVDPLLRSWLCCWVLVGVLLVAWLVRGGGGEA